MNKDLFINGRCVPAKQTYELYNPYNNQRLGTIANADEAEMLAAIEAADAAFAEMKALPAHQRSAILNRAAQLMEERTEELARLIALEAGKPIKAARAEVGRSVQTLRFSAEGAKWMNGESIPMDAAIGGEGRLAFTVTEPLGVVAAITPFNFPLNLVTHKVGPALAVGNTVVLKPAEQTPLSSYALAEILAEAGLPAGALNVVSGEGAVLGPVLTADARIKKLSFTGSPEVGKLLRAQSGLKKLTLELGSNSALIVDENCDLERCVARAVEGAFSYAGQVCIHTQRIYVHQNVYDTFTAEFRKRMEQLRTGDPLDENTDVSAVINERSRRRILEWIEEARSMGAVVYGGETEGSVIRPALILGADPSSRVVCQEVFGPVVVIDRVASLKEAVEKTNASRFGLNAGVFTRDIQAAFAAARKLEVGQVLINEIPTFRVDHMPYGGVKDSGLGREGVKYAMQEMSESKLIVVTL
ncbi:aldehyde dehydrogenase family protein [Brevibacillus massiliensis]|uniref:aldehyde dehydrogenase family protein n=1 Tax=Brevibacillus massiliensis TaxID=1118054 RepID=UPI0002DC52D5|nr:aldehyde dehydrogenase family protein [Brevibacillus massiliensis]